MRPLRGAASAQATAGVLTTPRDQPPSGNRQLDGLFAAIADPIRRDIVARLTQGPCSVTRIGAPYAVSAPAISKHLAVLERCGLIERWKSGRVHYCRLLGEPLAQASDWIDRHREFWDRQFDALEQYLDREEEMRSAEGDGLPAPSALQLHRRFRAPRERVFHALTQPAALREWWCPPGWIAGEITIDLRVGGAYRFAMRRLSDGNEVAVGGRFLDVRPPERLVYTWRWEGAFAALGETRVTMALHRAEQDTVVTLTHESFAQPTLCEQHRTGWIAACNRLDRLLTPQASG